MSRMVSVVYDGGAKVTVDGVTAEMVAALAEVQTTINSQRYGRIEIDYGGGEPKVFLRMRLT